MLVAFPAPPRIGPIDDSQVQGGIPGSLVGHAGDPSAVSDSYPTPIFDPVHAHDRTVLKSELPSGPRAEAAEAAPPPPPAPPAEPTPRRAARSRS